MASFRSLLEQLALVYDDVQNRYDDAQHQIATLHAQAGSASLDSEEPASTWSRKRAPDMMHGAVPPEGKTNLEEGRPQNALEDGQMHRNEAPRQLGRSAPLARQCGVRPESSVRSSVRASVTQDPTMSQSSLLTLESLGLDFAQSQLSLRPAYAASDTELRSIRPRTVNLEDTLDDFEIMQKQGRLMNRLSKNYNVQDLDAEPCERFTLHPQSNLRIAWDVVGFFAVLYDIIVMPLGLLTTADHSWMSDVSGVITAFWTLDIALNFCTGVQRGREVIMGCRSIAYEYTRRWLLFDVLVLLPDWVLLMIHRQKHHLTLRMLKVVRMARLLRITKLQRLLGDILKDEPSLKTTTYLHFLRVAVGAAVCLHVMACVWFVVGDTANGWVAAAGLQSAEIGDVYTVVIHWALMQLQGGMWDIAMLTVKERVYAIISLALATFLMALGIASITQIFHYSVDIRNDRAGQRLWLRAFANRHKLPKELEVSVRKFIECKWSMKQVRARDASLLSVLPEALRKDLMIHINGDVLMGHPLFKFLRRRNVHVIRDLCMGMAGEDFTMHDVLFVPGDSCTAVRFFTAGSLKYYRASQLQRIQGDGLLRHESFDDSPCDPHVDARPIVPGAWLSEAVLWTVWEHCGKLVAMEQGSCTLLLSKDAENVMQQHPVVRWMATLYARQFIAYMNRTKQSDFFRPPKVESWDPEAMETSAEEARNLPFENELPEHIQLEVVKACVRLAREVACDGLPESQKHHGFTIIVGDAARLSTCGVSNFNPFKGNELSVVDSNARDAIWRNAFHSDGAVVIDGMTGHVVASGWFVRDISLGGSDGGARSRSAKAVAQQAGGCYVIKCSEDSHGKLILHLGDKMQIFDAPLKADESISVRGC